MWTHNSLGGFVHLSVRPPIGPSVTLQLKTLKMHIYDCLCVCVCVGGGLGCGWVRLRVGGPCPPVHNDNVTLVICLILAKVNTCVSYACREKSWSQSLTFWHIPEKHGIIFFLVSCDSWLNEPSNEIERVSKFDNSFIWRLAEYSMKNIFWVMIFSIFLFWKNSDSFFSFLYYLK